MVVKPEASKLSILEGGGAVKTGLSSKASSNQDFGGLPANSGASNVTFSCGMTWGGSAAARHANSSPDRPVCLPTAFP